MTGLAKEEIVQRAPSVLDAELVSAWEDTGKKALKDAANASIATSAWQVEMMKIGNYFKPTHNYVTVFLELQKLKTSRNLPAARAGRRLTEESVSLVWLDSTRKHIGAQEILHENAVSHVASKAESYKQELQ